MLAFIFADLIVLPILDIVFLAFVATLLDRYFRRRGLAILRTLNKPVSAAHSHYHAHA